MSTVIKVEGCGVCPMGDNGHFCNYGDFPLDRSLRLGVRPWSRTPVLLRRDLSPLS